MKLNETLLNSVFIGYSVEVLLVGRSVIEKQINFVIFDAVWYSINIIKAFIFKHTKTSPFYLCFQPKLAQLCALLTSHIPKFAREWD